MRGSGPPTERIDLFAGDLEVVFASHHWPTWGPEPPGAFLKMQRDMYAYLHDQTLRLMNQGYVGSEYRRDARDAPGSRQGVAHARLLDGSVSHNIKAIYQRYMGWYTGNPAVL